MIALCLAVLSKPCARSAEFVWSPEEEPPLYCYVDPSPWLWFSDPSALLRILRVEVIDLSPSSLPVYLMASFIIASLQGAWGSADSALYLFSTLVTICTILSSPSLGDQSKWRCSCMSEASVNLGFCMSQTGMQASPQGTVGTSPSPTSKLG